MCVFSRVGDGNRHRVVRHGALAELEDSIEHFSDVEHVANRVEDAVEQHQAVLADLQRLHVLCFRANSLVGQPQRDEFADACTSHGISRCKERLSLS